MEIVELVRTSTIAIMMAVDFFTAICIVMILYRISKDSRSKSSFQYMRLEPHLESQVLKFLNQNTYDSEEEDEIDRIEKETVH